MRAEQPVRLEAVQNDDVTYARHSDAPADTTMNARLMARPARRTMSLRGLCAPLVVLGVLLLLLLARVAAAAAAQDADTAGTTTGRWAKSMAAGRTAAESAHAGWLTWQLAPLLCRSK